ncbi:MAG: DUF1656 domain-containing protein [Haliea sp.]|nr:DUF1656 domain-containing protein [Haliea sp.]
MPHELAVGDVYFSPTLPVFSLALVATWLTIKILNKLRLSRYIMFPSLTFLTLMTVYMLLMNTYWIRI